MQVTLCLGDCRLFWAETGNILQSATLFSHFSESKGGKKLCVLLTLDYFWLKESIHFNLQPYTPSFRNRKRGKRFSRLKRRRESVATWRISPYAIYFLPHSPYQSDRLTTTVRPCSLRQNRRATGARMGLVSKQNLFISALTLMPCHAAVCVNFILCAKMQFLCVISQSTGLTFLPSLPTAR